ncbi:Polyphenol oxidase 1 [Lachnellula cervina]|uniref:Polyphenol oxidase 1 n=1 Tax=Lachnellula cervina TaxID=1316786 RepID=A0A7D8YU95_9HELO|nr:Polyphenol oxidase 1 [Lachnellula cervina]
MLSNRLFGPCCFLLSLVASIAAARHHSRASGLSPRAFPVETAHDSAEGGNYYPITGVNTGRDAQTGARPFRQNILDLQNDGPSWSLYIQALTAMQNADDNDPLSYFQVAGIHGRPYRPWNNFNQVQGAGPGTSAFGGYCTHNSVLFPTWHRPYLALVEQVIAGHAQDIAKQYTGPSSSDYQTAADNLRLPYWDWASIAEMPDVVNQPTVTITTPDGDQDVDNPLFTYKFHQFPHDPTLFPGGGLANSPQTWRDNSADQSLQNSNLMNRAWYALTKSNNYSSFATLATSGTSIEGVHNGVHASIGGQNGFMTFLDYSAFDPIFWLHHTNVDRLSALWQAANPNKYVTPMTDPGTFTIVPKSIDTVSTSLTPFTSNNIGTAHTSISARYLSYFDYSYPEIEDWTQTPAQLKANVTSQIYDLYDPNQVFGPRHDHRQSRTLRARKALTPGSTTKEWTIDISVNKFDLNGEGFWVRFFVGDIPQNPQDWLTNAASVGSVQVMPTPHLGEGPFPELLEYDELNLDGEITKAGYDPQDIHTVARHFEKNLQWRVQKLDGSVVPTEQIPSLNIAVQDETVTFPSDNTEMPTYEEKTVHPDVTKGKCGGRG